MNDDQQATALGGEVETRPLDPMTRIEGMRDSLDVWAAQVGELQVDIGNFALIVSLGQQAMDLARRTLVAEYHLLLAQEELARKEADFDAQMVQMREELERRNVTFAHHQAAITELSSLRVQLQLARPDAYYEQRQSA